MDNLASSNKKMCCSPKCIYFPDVTCSSYDFELDNKTGLKRRKVRRDYICGYDGHVITNWYSPCPKELEKQYGTSNRKSKNKIKLEVLRTIPISEVPKILEDNNINEIDINENNIEPEIRVKIPKIRVSKSQKGAKKNSGGSGKKRASLAKSARKESKNKGLYYGYN